MSGFTKLDHKEKYEYHHPQTTDPKLYNVTMKADNEATKLAFRFPAIIAYCKSKVPGKKVLDIGCGTGYGSCLAAECGAKSVDGFDIQEDMVKLAKQATAKYNSVNICVGDVMKMPYKDNTFDIALSLYVICALQVREYTSHFKELHRVLAPGGTALVVNLNKSAFDTMLLVCGADKVAVTQQINDELLNLPNFPTQKEINDAFKEFHEVLLVAFAINKDGWLHRITNVSELSNGQAVWSKTQIMVYPGYYYDEYFLHDQIRTSGLHIDCIENVCTEERRLSYNSTCTNPKDMIDKIYTDYPPYNFYHLSKKSS